MVHQVVPLGWCAATHMPISIQVLQQPRTSCFPDKRVCSHIMLLWWWPVPERYTEPLVAAGIDGETLLVMDDNSLQTDLKVRRVPCERR